MMFVRRLSALFAFSSVLSCLNMAASPEWPGPAGRALELVLARTDHNDTKDAVSERTSGRLADADDADIVRTLPVCIASPAWSAGELGRSVLFHARRDGRRMTVGYFVYWT